MTATLPAWLCKHCGHKWPIKTPHPPANCPRCGRMTWRTGKDRRLKSGRYVGWRKRVRKERAK